MIELSKLTKKFEGKTAVENLSIKIGPGEIYGVIGPNGSGKTTTIKMMTGIISPTDGTIKIDGVEIQEEPVEVKAKIGYIPDDPFVWEKLTGREFIHFVSSMYGLHHKTIESELLKYLKLFPIEDVLDNFVGNYSRGTKQKLTIIAALIHKPKILVIDEPIVGLDPESIERALSIFSDFSKMGGSIFLATHTLTAVQKLCNRVGLLKEGKLIEEGTIESLGKKAKISSKNIEEIYFKLMK